MIWLSKFPDALEEYKTKHLWCLTWDKPFLEAVPDRFKHGMSRSTVTVSKAHALPSWFENANSGWVKHRLSDTRTYRLLSTFFQVLLIRGHKSANHHAACNDARREFSNWFQGIQKNSDAFCSLVYFYVSSPDFLDHKADVYTGNDPRLDGLGWLWSRLLEEIGVDDGDGWSLFETIQSGWLSSPEALKEEFQRVLEYILRVQARKELFEIHLARGYQESSTKTLLDVFLHLSKQRAFN